MRGRRKNDMTDLAPLHKRKTSAHYDTRQRAGVQPLQERRDGICVPTSPAAIDSSIIAAPGGAKHCPTNIATGAEPGAETSALTTTHSDARVRLPYKQRNNLRTPPSTL